MESCLMTPKTVREQVTMKLRDELVAGQYPGGSVLREAELAARLGVSRGPVRDAFLQLSQEGFLAYQANRGVTVRHPPNRKNRTFIVSLRIQIESFAVENGLADINDEGLAQIRFSLENLQKACAGDDAAQVARCDMGFHEAILLACGGEDLIQAWRQLCAKMLMNYSRLTNYTEVYAEHMSIMAPVQSQNVKATIKALRDNIK